MLAMFQDVSFLSSNVTFKRAEDDRIAKERRSLACARENRQLWPSTMDSIASNGIPRVVVELVAEEVHSERGAFVDVCANAHDIFQKLGDADPCLLSIHLGLELLNAAYAVVFLPGVCRRYIIYSEATTSDLGFRSWQSVTVRMAFTTCGVIHRRSNVCFAEFFSGAPLKQKSCPSKQLS